ncbi:deoxynucleotidyltransferase terminal-interacting protein 2 [Polymixia lowei]
MVATRRGVRVYSPTKTNSDESSGVQATPSTSRITRRTAKQAETPAQEKEGSNSQPDGGEGGPPVSPHSQITLKRCSRASRLHSPEQPSTPAGSIHEADVSDVDSCCSAVSDIERPMTRSQRRKRQSRLLRREEDEVSEVESCSSTVSTSKGDSSVSCRGPRTRAARAKAAASVVVSEPQSCDSEGFESGPSKPRRSTRSRGKAKSTAKDSDSEVTDVYSPMGSPCATRGTGTPCSSRTGSGNSSRAALTTRLSAKVLRVVLESASDPGNREGEGEPTVTAVNSQAGKVTVSEPTEEESVLSDHRLDSTVMTDPDCTVLEDMTLTLEEEEGDEDDKEGVTSTDLRSDNGTPEDTEVIEVGNQGSVKLSMAADVMSETTTNTTEAEKGVVIVHEEDEEMNTPADFQAPLTHSVVALDNHSQTKESQSVGEAAVTVDRQQRELSVSNKNDDTSELQPTQETVPSSESLELPSCQSVKVMCESAASSEAAGVTKEDDKAMEIGDVDNHTNDQPPQTERLQDKHLDRDTNVETLCVREEEEEEEEEMEVCTSNAGDQQVVVLNEVPLSPSVPDHKQVEPIQVTSGQEQKVTVEPGSEQEPKDSVVVQKTGIISLLESSEDEDGYVEEDESSGEEEEKEEDLRIMEEEKAGPSKKSKVAAASLEGLFMIDTRPGQEADEQYYKEDPSEKAVEQEEQDEEEFVDEEGDEDEDDEDAQMLFFSRNPKSKELSSHIDPGLGVKELGGLYINFDGSKSKPVSSSLKKLKEQKIQDEVMKKSVIGPEFEKNSAAPPYSKSKRTLKLRRKVEREKTTGDGWFNMKAPELTQELKGDLKVLKMRGSLDPKRFYKKNDRDGLPKYFQVGTVVDNPVDFYHSRVPKKQRKRTMVEELLADAEFRHTNKKKYQQIMTEKAAQGAGKLKKNKFYKK